MAINLSVPYRYGFEVKYDPMTLWSAERDVFVGLEGKHDWGDDAFDEYDALVTTFYMLAETGALAGSAIEPWSSRFADRAVHSRSSRSLVWVLRGCRSDEASTVLCANTMSLGDVRFPIQRISIASDPALSSARQQLAVDMARIDPYPAVYGKLPFPYSISSDSNAPTLTLQLVRAAGTAAGEIRDQLLAWAAACSGGVYGAVSALPRDCYLMVDPADLRIDGTEVEFSISKLNCHEAALRGLINACGALHRAVVPIASASID